MSSLTPFLFQLGAERRQRGVELREVISSLTLLRRQVLAFALHPGIREQVLDAYKVLELAHRTMLFFDRAIYHMARGYANGDV